MLTFNVPGIIIWCSILHLKFDHHLNKYTFIINCVYFAFKWKRKYEIKHKIRMKHEVNINVWVATS